MRQLYLAATGMNRGKTTVALGLLAALLDRGLDIGFIKPVGQRYAIVDGQPADEDAILMRSALGLQRSAQDDEPGPHSARLHQGLHPGRGHARSRAAASDKSHSSVAQKHDLLLIEGTGHAGVGSVVGLSNAQVARMLRAPAAIVAEAGVGRPIDEIVLNRALFARHGVEVVGAIVNKVDADAHPTLPDVLRDGLAKHGIELLGMLPYRPLLSNPTLSMLVEQVKGEILNQGEDLDRVIEHVAIGAMQPRHLMERVGPGSLLIVPSDRTDVIHAIVAANRASREGAARRGFFTRRRQVFGRAPEDPESNRAGRPRPHRWLHAAAARPRGNHAGATLRDARRHGHVRGGLPGPRPAGQDPPGRPGEDRADAPSGQRAPGHRQGADTFADPAFRSGTSTRAERHSAEPAGQLVGRLVQLFAR